MKVARPVQRRLGIVILFLQSNHAFLSDESAWTHREWATEENPTRVGLSYQKR
jgi:hypothetical protein